MRIIQVLNALDYGDGVSNDVINKHEMFLKMGYESYIYCKWVNSKVEKYACNIQNLDLKQDDILLHHFSGVSYIMNEICAPDCYKVLVYHNITPPIFFGDTSGSLDEGEIQLLKYKDQYDYFVGDSQFNIECLKKIGIKGPFMEIPILINFASMPKEKSKTLKESSNQIVLSFIGRIAENKKQEDIIGVFDYYFNNINCNSKLYLVGNYENNKEYYLMLQQYVKEKNLNNNIIFTGKVNDRELYNYYSNSDIFLCMSEHEGFCIPLLESMYYNIPTIAYSSCAVPAVMGDAGVLLYEKNYVAISKLIHYILSNKDLKKKIIEKQNNHLKKYLPEVIESKFKNFFGRILEGER